MTGCARPSLLSGYFQLFRVPNVFTAAADVMMGYLFTPSLYPTAMALPPLVGTSCLLYTSGVVINDVVDRKLDARQRPGRPIPVGAISLAAACCWGGGLLIAGVAVAWVVSLWVDCPRTGAGATILAIAILGYNSRLKTTPLGPLVMGCCRLLNVLLGMSLSAKPWEGANWLVAVGLGIYVTGLTWFARSEWQRSDRWQLGMATLVSLSAMAILADLSRWRALYLESFVWWLSWGFLATIVGWRCLAALVRPSAEMVQMAVKHGVYSIILLDSLVCLGAQKNGGWSIAVLALLLPTVWLGRRFPAT